jgi:putative ABC transport system permease protein
MDIPLLAGRTFYPAEKSVVIVSQSMARRQWPNTNPLGQTIGDDTHKSTVIGVVGDAHINGLNEDDAVEQYWPILDENWPDMTLVVKVAGEPGNLAPTAKSISESLDPKIFPEIRPLKTLYRDNVKVIEQIAAVVSLIGLVAVLLAGVGIVGLVGFTVSQRTKEIAIRIALGARPSAVLESVLRQFRWPVLLGLVLGTGVAAGASKILRRGLYGVSNLDPASYIGALLVLLVIVALAALIPARRALRLDLARTLHYD